MRPLMDWYELRFRLQLWFIQSWLVRPIVWLRLLFVDKSEWFSDAREKSAAALQGSAFGKFRRTEVNPANPMSTAEIRVQVTSAIERTRALTETKSFLLKLADPTREPRVPKSVREHARALLQHYPAYVDIEAAHKALPEQYASVYPPGLLDDPLQPYARGKK